MPTGPILTTTLSRPAAVAGMFYPAQPQALQREVDALLQGAGRCEPRFSHPKALVVPHAGYIYSGPAAAEAYDELSAARGIVRRVVLLGPVHRVPVRGLALPGVDAFDTPLGSVPIDAVAVQALAGLPQVVTSRAAHAREHALEVQLPFLQRVLERFSLLPLAVGDATQAEVMQVLERLWGGPETLILLSTDLSHFHDYADAAAIDADTAARIERLEPGLSHQQACGATPLNGLLGLARARGMRIRRLALCNSGDTAGGRDRVVGYASFALEEAQAPGLDEIGHTLLGLARASIAHRLGLGPAPQADRSAAPWLARPGASFITLSLQGRLRGCIGSLAAARSLDEDVIANAALAAFRDPRFAPLTAAEWPQVQVEVSVLSAPKPLEFADEAELLSRLVPGEDGLILEKDGRRGTFLPQVWETLPEPRQFLAQLRLKAGLPADTRLAGCKLWRYRVRKWTPALPH
jgi:AmmeMemoRadiSam system protein B/AmmeMemoRadiSam system protein A